MSKTKLRRGRRELCVGDLDNRVLLQDRSIEAPAFNSADFTEKFEDLGGVWASLETRGGKTIFDDHQQRDRVVTHEIGIRYDQRVTAETWLLLADGRRLDILDSEDLDGRHKWIVMQCTDRGTQDDTVSEL